MHPRSSTKSPVAVAIAAAWLIVPLTSHADEIDFDRDVRPIFIERCGECHGQEKQQGGLRFDVRDGADRAGDSGAAAIVPGKPDESEVIRRVSSPDDDVRMPPEQAALSPEQIDLLRRWIEAGASWPDDGNAEATVGRRELVVTDEDRAHWAFQPLQAVEPPDVGDEAWVRTPIDQFILAAQANARLTPSTRAAPGTLVRRVYFDLVGLPPTPEEIAAFEAESAGDPAAALDALVERLLASPRYGERWGRHWLDVARYADSDGQESDTDRPFAYPYRDFVITAFHDDLPFDTFVRWQLAGDEIEPDNPRAVAATGFLTAGVYTTPELEMEEERLRNRYNELDDMLSTIGSGLLGMTVACARCHDHKYDPIPTRDYYRLLSALHSGDRKVVLLVPRAEAEEFESEHAAWNERLRTAESKRSELGLDDDEARKAASDDEQRRYSESTAEIDAIKAEEPPSPPQALAFRDDGAQRKPSWLFSRSDFYDRDEPVELGFLTVLTQGKAPQEYWQEAQVEPALTDSTQQRKALAAWITDVEQGGGALLARVLVNRIWRHHFGEGLVRTPSDFGRRGEPPTHPQLLEWLANDFVTNGWKIGRLHRQILASAVYSQASTFDSEKAGIDPENRLLWRRRPLRIEAEILRDSLLAVSGELNLAAFGPAFKPPIPDEALVARNVQDPYPTGLEETEATKRRSVYMFHKRVVPYPLLQSFDRPDLLQSCARRDATTVAPQALALLNDRFVRDRALAFADRLGDDDAEAIDLAYQLALGRPPRESERDASRKFLDSQTQSRQARGSGSPEEIRRQVRADFCQTLFWLNEFLYVD